MPRTGRGGARQGTPGTAYPNRSDLTPTAPVPVQAATNQPYGEAGQQEAAQRVLPVAPPPAVPSPGGGGGAPVPGGAGPGAPAPQGPVPGQMPWTHPTQRPNEPVTAGLPTGPGAGPEALSGVGALSSAQNGNPQATLRDVLGQMASQPGASSVVKDMASAAGAGRM